jgi:hypothetical protein
MAFVTSAPRPLPASLVRTRPATSDAPLTEQPLAAAAPAAEEGTHRERIRMELLVARARAARS